MTTPEHQEQSLVAFGYAPGNYFCICCSCNSQFQGDKRAPRCKSCAEKLQEKQVADSTKTTPERGLFERIKDSIDMHHCCSFPQQIEKICVEHEQRLAEAEKELAARQIWENAHSIAALEQRLLEAEKEHDRLLNIIGAKEDERMEAHRQATQLRARCGELEGLIRDCNQSTSLLYGDFALCDCVDNTGEAYQSQYLADLLAQPAQELCTAHKRFPCRECGTTHFDGCQCGFCKQVAQEQKG